MGAITHYIEKAYASYGKPSPNKGNTIDLRGDSFDYCYSYFYRFYKENELNRLNASEKLETSCLQLAFYLASWGMFRGSSFLLLKSSKSFAKIIELISREETRVLWDIDVDKYSDENIKLLINFGKKIKEAFHPDKPTDTLVTKIMLGVFANVPAFDRYFREGFKSNKFDEKALHKIKKFYDENCSEIDNLSQKYKVHNFRSLEMELFYTKAKLIDMYGYSIGGGTI